MRCNVLPRHHLTSFSTRSAHMRRTLVAIASLACSLGLALPSTAHAGYGPAGSVYNMGYRDTKGPGKLITVSYRSSFNLTPAMVQKMVLYRCAELAKANNKPFFMLYTTLSKAAQGKHDAWPTVRAEVGHEPNFSIVWILLLDEPGPGALDSQFIIEDLERVVMAIQAN